MKVSRDVLVLLLAMVLTATAKQVVYAETVVVTTIAQYSEVETDYCGGTDGDRLVYDDGFYESADDATTIVSLFTPPSYPFHFTHGCICWVSEISGITLDFEVVIYADTGNGPGQLIARYANHIEEISRWITTPSIVQVPINYILNSGSVYIGASKVSDVEAYLCGDQSTSTVQQTIFQSDNRGTALDWEPMAYRYRAMSIWADGEFPHHTFSATDDWINSSPGDLSLPVAIYPGSIEVFAIDPNTGEGILSVRVNNEQIESAGIPSAAQGYVLLATGTHPITGRRIEVYRLASGEFQLHTQYWDGSAYQVIWSAADEGPTALESDQGE